MDEIKREEISKVLKDAEKAFPYRVVGKHETYSDFNQGWSYAVDYIASKLRVEY